MVSPLAKAQALGYSTGSPRSGLGGKKTSPALSNAIAQSQARFPKAWAKATGTADIGKQLKQVTGQSANKETFFIAHVEKVEKQIQEIRAYASKFHGNHPQVPVLYQRANDLEKTKYDTTAFTPEPKTKPPSIYGGQFVPDKPPVLQTTPTVTEGVQLTGISEGATVTFLNPTTSATTTQPQMPTGSGVSQTEYNILTEKYDKETADKLATQTYLTRGEVRAKFPQFGIEPTLAPSTPTPPPAQPSKPPTYPAPSTPAPAFSPLSIFPLILVAVVLIGVLLFLRRRA